MVRSRVVFIATREQHAQFCTHRRLRSARLLSAPYGRHRGLFHAFYARGCRLPKRWQPCGVVGRGHGVVHVWVLSLDFHRGRRLRLSPRSHRRFLNGVGRTCLSFWLHLFCSSVETFARDDGRRIHPESFWRRNSQDVFVVDWSKPTNVWLCASFCPFEFHVHRARITSGVFGSYLRRCRSRLHSAWWLLGSLLHRHVSVHVFVSNRLHANGAFALECRRL